MKPTKVSTMMVLPFIQHALGVMQGEVSTFTAVQEASGYAEVSELYDTCVWYDSDGGVAGKGATCVSTLVGYMFQAMAGAAIGTTVGTASNGSSNVQEFHNGSVGRRDYGTYGTIIKTVNDALSSSSGSQGVLRATDITSSDVHELDGFAAHMNVHGDGTALVVHTNGTHALARFGNSSAVRRRDYLPTYNQWFTFNGVNGIKMQAHEINGTLDQAYVADLQSFASGFAGSSNGARPAFDESDSWDYQVCDTACYPLFYGKLIAEEIQPGNNYEDVTPLGCATACQT
ncbi:hypothetical protein LTR85_012263 [Meristemomyces frigidus]|nr:hypothetical protein LTR85_012263 [Meristemomyces frigidus]